MKRIATILLSLLIVPGIVFALEVVSDAELDQVTGASVIAPPLMAQAAANNAGPMIAPFSMAQKYATDIQELTSPSSLASKTANDVQHFLSPVSDTQAIVGGLSF